MKTFLQKIYDTVTFRQSLVTTSATLVNGGLGALFYITSARFLGPSNFGLMMIAITVLTLVGDIADLGTNTGSVRFVGKYFEREKEKAWRFLKLGLEVKILVSIAVAIFGFFLSPYLSNNVFGKSELTSTLRIAFIGVGSYLLFTFVTSSFQATQKFYKWSFIQIATNLVRLIIIIYIFWIGVYSPNITLSVYAAVPFAGFLLGIFLLSTKFLRVKGELTVAKEFFHYNKWIALFALVAATGSRLDTFISARLLSSYEVGVYSAANQLVAIVPQIVGAIGAVVAPKMAGMGSLDKLTKYMKKLQLMVLGFAGLGILVIPFVAFLIPYLYGHEYLTSTYVFVVLLLGMLVFLISVPIHMAVFYYFSYPKLFFWISLGHLLIIAGLGWNLISLYGAMGAAVTVLIGQLFNFIVPLLWVLKKIRQSN